MVFIDARVNVLEKKMLSIVLYKKQETAIENTNYIEGCHRETSRRRLLVKIRLMIPERLDFC